MNKKIIGVLALGLSLCVGVGSSVVYFKIENIKDNAKKSLNYSVQQMKVIGFDASYKLDEKLTETTGKYLIKQSDKNILEFDFNVKHGFEEINKPILLKGTLNFSGDFKEGARSELKNIMSEKSLANILDTPLGYVETTFQENQIDANISIPGLSFSGISKDEKTETKLSLDNSKFKLLFDKKNNVIDMNYNLSSATLSEGKSQENIKNLNIHKQVQLDNVYIGPLTVSIGELSLKRKEQEIKMKDVKSLLSLEKKNESYGVSLNAKINSIKENLTGSDFKIDLESNLTELNQKGINEILSLIKKYQDKNIDKKDNLEKEKMKKQFKERFDASYNSIITSGFKYDLSKFIIEGIDKNGTSIGSFVAAMKVTVEPVDKIENFGVNNMIVQSIFQIKDSPYAPMLNMVVPQGVQMDNNGKNASLSVVLNKGNLYVNNKLIDFNPKIIEDTPNLIAK